MQKKFLILSILCSSIYASIEADIETNSIQSEHDSSTSCELRSESEKIEQVPENGPTSSRSSTSTDLYTETQASQTRSQLSRAGSAILSVASSTAHKVGSAAYSTASTFVTMSETSDVGNRAEIPVEPEAPTASLGNARELVLAPNANRSSVKSVSSSSVKSGSVSSSVQDNIAQLQMQMQQMQMQMQMQQANLTERTKSSRRSGTSVASSRTGIALPQMDWDALSHKSSLSRISQRSMEALYSSKRIRCWLERCNNPEETELVTEIIQFSNKRFGKKDRYIESLKQFIAGQQIAINANSEATVKLADMAAKSQENASKAQEEERKRAAELSEEKTSRLIDKENLMAEKKKLADAREDLADKNANLKYSTEARAKAESDIEKLERSINSKESELEAVKSAKHSMELDLTKESTANECNTRNMNEKNSYLQKLLEEANSTIASLSKDKESADETILKTVTKLSGLESKCMSQESEIDMLKAELNEYKAKNTKLEAEVAKIPSIAPALKEENKTLKSRLLEIQKKLTNKKEKVSLYDKLLETAENSQPSYAFQKVKEIYENSSYSKKDCVASKFIRSFNLNLDKKGEINKSIYRSVTLMLVCKSLDQCTGENIVGHILFLKEIFGSSQDILFKANAKPGEKFTTADLSQVAGLIRN
ncbi:hypothetical protein [Candidatus Nesciobacter abundans]|uniref:Uncharacterized protein n=1 Tax=Candidatus Nesciobacter abundans TaxID=2601668 RepID=A0A5C0UFQ4_9PROT|nr:hypothetical protein [Candidatus Nesciobacter abundans]QEK38936.1 hypothetical protein FZC36_00590 [Candidatus Nesciobacter abundans]